jgi:hypothetical protein
MPFQTSRFDAQQNPGNRVFDPEVQSSFLAISPHKWLGLLAGLLGRGVVGCLRMRRRNAAKLDVIDTGCHLGRADKSLFNMMYAKSHPSHQAGLEVWRFRMSGSWFVARVGGTPESDVPAVRWQVLVVRLPASTCR